MIAFIALGFLEAQPSPRDLSKYDALAFGVPVAIHYYSDNTTEYARVREFLWDHWKHERKGTVRVRTQWIEGISDTTYFVEPDKNGRWVIVVSSGGSERSCDRIERVEQGRRVPVIPIADDEPRNPDKYLVHPKCWADKPYAILW
jgi:hypothetical protein